MKTLVKNEQGEFFGPVTIVDQTFCYDLPQSRNASKKIQKILNRCDVTMGIYQPENEPPMLMLFPISLLSHAKTPEETLSDLKLRAVRVLELVDEGGVVACSEETRDSILRVIH